MKNSISKFVCVLIPPIIFAIFLCLFFPAHALTPDQILQQQQMIRQQQEQERQMERQRQEIEEAEKIRKAREKEGVVETPMAVPGPDTTQGACPPVLSGPA